MKKLSARTIAFLTNGILALILIVVGAVCFFPTSSHVSGVKERVLYRGSADDAVSLMFNVYWGSEEVEGILSVLEEHGAKATFFIGGSWADDNTALVRRIAEEGHEIASHGYFHRDHSALDYDGNYKEIKQSVDFLARASGREIALFAPPSGAYNDATVLAAESLGLKTVMWSRDTIDWRDKDESLCYARATENLQAGELILMHPMAHTLAALPRILDYCAAQGLRVVTVSENIG